jgi:omega-6 fatty acid desaturase (delta-12 desaturase)
LAAVSAVQETPRNLAPVVKLIPARCYDNPTSLGLAYVARDFAVYALVLFGLASTDVWWQLAMLWVVSALSVSALFIVGHDAAHGSLFKSARLNSWVGHLTMLPSLHVYEGWRFGHNRMHHGHTARQGLDFVWHPVQESDYLRLGRLQRLLVRLQWSWAGAGLYYGVEIWWKYMMRTSPGNQAAAIRRDRAIVVGAALVAAGAAGAAGVSIYGTALGGVWLVFKLIVVPAALFMWVIGATVYLHHIAPDIRWWPRRQWNKFKGQMEGTTIMRLPPGLDFFFHSIFTHVPHHVDMRIPFYRLDEAAAAIIAGFPDSVRSEPVSLRKYVRATRICKLYDFEAGCWRPYPSRDAVADG